MFKANSFSIDRLSLDSGRYGAHGSHRIDVAAQRRACVIAPKFGHLHLTSRQYINKGYIAELYCAVMHQHHSSDVTKKCCRQEIAAAYCTASAEVQQTTQDIPLTSLLHRGSGRMQLVGHPKTAPQGTQACVSGSFEGRSVNSL